MAKSTINPEGQFVHNLFCEIVDELEDVGAGVINSDGEILIPEGFGKELPELVWHTRQVEQDGHVGIVLMNSKPHAQTWGITINGHSAARTAAFVITAHLMTR